MSNANVKFREQKWNKFINETLHNKLYMYIDISNWRNWIFAPTKMSFLIHFNSVHDYCLPSTLNALVHDSWVEMELCEYRASHLLKMRKNKIS